MSDINNSIRKLRFWSTIATWSIFAFMALTIIFSAISIMLGSNFIAIEPENVDIFQYSALGSAVSFFISVIGISFWIYRAHANLYAWHIPGLQFTPGWSVGWFFVPIANLFQPYQAMQELWDRSVADGYDSQVDRSNPLGWWWGSFLIGGFASNIGSRLLDSPDWITDAFLLTGIGELLRVASAGFLFNIIRTVTHAQSNARMASETFA